MINFERITLPITNWTILHTFDILSAMSCLRILVPLCILYLILNMRLTKEMITKANTLDVVYCEKDALMDIIKSVKKTYTLEIIELVSYCIFTASYVATSLLILVNTDKYMGPAWLSSLLALIWVAMIVLAYKRHVKTNLKMLYFNARLKELDGGDINGIPK